MQIHNRRYLLSEIGIEIFTKTDKTYFFNLFKSSWKKEFFKTIETLKIKHVTIVTNRKEQFKKCAFFDKWIKGDISNFNYIMMLNTYSGRSFNDIS